MRPRFTLKWLIIGFTVLSVAFYFFFVRPTALANRLVDLVEHDDLKSAESLFIEPSKPFDLGRKDNTGLVLVQAELSPRKWLDVLKMQRRLEVLVVQTERHLASGGKINHLGMRFQATAGLFGVRGSQKVFIAFSGVDTLIAARKKRLGQ